MTEAVQTSENQDSDGLGLSDEKIAAILETFREAPENINDQIEVFSPADTADFFQKIGDDDRRLFLEHYADKLDPYVFSLMDTGLCKSILAAMPPAKVASIMSLLESDDALELISNLDDDFQKDVIRNLSAKIRVAIEEGLTFPEDSAGRLMQREYVAVPEFWSVGKTVDYLRAAGDTLPEDFPDIIIIDPAYHVVGEIPLSRLVRASRTQKLEDLTLDTTHPIPADMDQEEVAQIFKRESLGSAPVVDNDKRLIGIITFDDIIHVIEEEAEEDILKLAGVEDGDLYRAILSTAGSRFRWLFVNLITAILASVVISFFDASIEKIVALAILMPIVASMGGNAGTQALTVAVRALATKELSDTNMYRIIWKETLVGTLNGIGFAIIMGLVAWIWFNDPLLGSIIAAAMILNLIVAGFFGAGIPIFLHRTGSDPAVSSTVFLTTMTDVIGFLAFLGLASLFLI